MLISNPMIKFQKEIKLNPERLFNTSSSEIFYIHLFVRKKYW
jgi:hypothetical protein